MKLSSSILGLIAGMLVQAAPSSDGAVTISDQSTNSSSPYFYSLMFEDINGSGESGLYGELLVNRAPQGPSPNITGWHGIGGAYLQAAYHPLSDALPMSLRVDIPPQKLPEVGVWNEGWQGIDVQKGRKYKARFYVEAPDGFDGEFKVSLRDAQSREHLADAVAKPQQEDTNLYPKKSNNFVHYEAELTATKDAKSLNNGLYIVLEDGSKYSGQRFWFNILSLFPDETFADRENGLRKDLAEKVDGMGMTMLRLSGNNLEGKGSPYNRWQWNETIGPLTDRPGRFGNWHYVNSDGLGLGEMLDWCEDMDLAPLLSVYSGLTLSDDGINYSVEGEFLEPYIEDALNELEYITGDTDTKYGKLRQQHGREKPWKLDHVQIGNENQFASEIDSGSDAGEQFDRFYKAIHKKYPDLILSSSSNNNITFDKFGNDEIWNDIHYYEAPDFFVKNFAKFDNYKRNSTKQIVDEYQCITSLSGDRLGCPDMSCSVAEAVFLIGMERNSDQVVSAAYAPVLFNADTHGSGESMLGFGLKEGDFTETTSFLIHNLFANHQGDKILQLDNAAFDPLYYVAVQNTKKKEIYLKVANYADKSTSVKFNLDVKGMKQPKASGKYVSSSDPAAGNCPTHQNDVHVQDLDVKVDGTTIEFEAGPYFAGVVTIKN